MRPKEGTGAVASFRPTSLKTQCVFRALGPSTTGFALRSDNMTRTGYGCR
jgi:hypothetical protein